MFRLHPSQAPASALDAASLRLFRAHLYGTTAAMAIAVCPPLIGAWLAQQSGNWELFQRSGNVIAAVGLLLASVRYIRHGVVELAALQAKQRRDIELAELWEEILTAKLGLALSAFGSVISGWGWYLGWWSFCFVLVWMVAAVAAARRDVMHVRKRKGDPPMVSQQLRCDPTFPPHVDIVKRSRTGQPTSGVPGPSRLG